MMRFFLDSLVSRAENCPDERRAPRVLILGGPGATDGSRLRSGTDLHFSPSHRARQAISSLEAGRGSQHRRVEPFPHQPNTSPRIRRNTVLKQSTQRKRVSCFVIGKVPNERASGRSSSPPCALVHNRQGKTSYKGRYAGNRLRVSGAQHPQTAVYPSRLTAASVHNRAGRQGMAEVSLELKEAAVLRGIAK